MTAEEVRALPVGMTIKAIKEGHEPVICTVAFRGTVKNKFLTYRDKGELKITKGWYSEAWLIRNEGFRWAGV